MSTTVTLQPDGSAGVDTRMDASNPTLNFGITPTLQVGSNSLNLPQITRTLIKFNLSSIPAGATIESATLSLYAILDRSNNARTYRVYRMKLAWLEGTGNVSASGDGATWNTYNGVNNWTAAGGFDPADCEQTDIGSRVFTATETIDEFKAISLTPVTKAGLDLGYGWLIKADTENADTYQFAASEAVAADTRPKLVITYILPPVAAFSGTPLSGTAPLTVAFADESTNTPTSWSWNFGDGETSVEQNPTHEYAAAGTYTVSLTATNADGNDTETKVDYVTVNPAGGSKFGLASLVPGFWY